MRIIGYRSELTAQGVVEVVVPNLQATLAFYRDVGFVVERMTPTFVALRYEDLYVFLAENPDAPSASRWTNVRILVADVDAVWRRIQDRKIAIGTPIGDRAYGLRDFTVKDPAGFEIRFAQVIAPADAPSD